MDPDNTARSSIERPSHTTVTQMRWACVGPWRFPNCWPRVHELPGTQISCLCGFSSMTPLAHITPPPFLQQESPISAQGFVVNVCICFHQLLGRIFLMTAGVQSRNPLHYCWESYLGLSLWIPGVFRGTRFLPNPKIPPIKTSLLFLCNSINPPTCLLHQVCPLPHVPVPCPPLVYKGDFFYFAFPGKSIHPSLGPAC